MPSPATTLSTHVGGPMVLMANIGASHAYVSVGIPRDGIDIEFEPFTHDVKSDMGGGPEGDAVEVLFLNYSARVRCDLVHYAGTYVDALRAMSQASATEGTMPTPGTAMGAGGFLPAIKFASADIDGGFLFSTCQVKKAGDLKSATTESMPGFLFRAINYVNPASVTSINTNVLYSRV